jgi:diguanylate cyclase (GGDEF)-like protein/PAS domain S-box-containing protein
MPARQALRPFNRRSGWLIAAIMATFLVTAAVGVTITLTLSGRARAHASIVQVAARQRTLAERYLSEVLLASAGEKADPATTAAVLGESGRALLEGGTAPGVNGDDDATGVPRPSATTLRAQIEQENKLIGDLRAGGEAVLANGRRAAWPLTAGEHLTRGDALQRLRVIAALTSATALDVARTIAAEADDSVENLLRGEVALAVGGLLLSLLLTGALIVVTGRQAARFRALAKSSTDLVAVLDEGHGCRYVSDSLASLLGRPREQLLGAGLLGRIHEDDRELIEEVARTASPTTFSFRVPGPAGDWRHLDARVTDLRNERHLRGVVINARDTTERVRLEAELTEKARRDGFASQLSEALEMADEEDAVCEVVEHAMSDVSGQTPMELLLSDSSRANLRRAAFNPLTDPPGCPVGSPFSCVAVRRGSAVVFDSSERLNACPHLRGRPGGDCSAVCVPVSFMGRSLGVLHTTGPDHEPLAREQVERLRTLAGQAGARIGTVRAFQKTQLQASTDGLTGLVNRRTAEQRLRELLSEGGMFALALADLDRFKQLNDTHGHEVGDRALRLFSQVASGSLRDHDMIARWGGEEFVLILPELDRFEAVEVMNRLRAALARAHPGETPRFTVSFGVTDSDEAPDLEELFRIADDGLYAAKQGGRDRATIGQGRDASRADGSDGRDGAGDAVPGVKNGGRRRQGQATRSAKRPAHRRPALQQAAMEEEPPSSGAEIR